jgi:hypothetical protein
MAHPMRHSRIDDTAKEPFEQVCKHFLFLILNVKTGGRHRL